MAKKLGFYKCLICGNIVEVYVGAKGELTCCNQPMELMQELEADSSTEKHVPVVEKIQGGYKVVVGSTLHPMQEEHYIEWIELVVDNKAYTKFLAPDDSPEAIFMVEGENVYAREHCNKHGLWKS